MEQSPNDYDKSRFSGLVVSIVFRRCRVPAYYKKYIIDFPKQVGGDYK